MAGCVSQWNSLVHLPPCSKSSSKSRCLPSGNEVLNPLGEGTRWVVINCCLSARILASNLFPHHIRRVFLKEGAMGEHPAITLSALDSVHKINCHDLSE